MGNDAPLQESFRGMAGDAYLAMLNCPLAAWLLRQLFLEDKDQQLGQGFYNLEKVITPTSVSGQQDFIGNAEGFLSILTAWRFWWLVLTTRLVDPTFVVLQMEGIEAKLENDQKTIFDKIKKDDNFITLVPFMNNHFYAATVVFGDDGNVTMVVCDGLNCCHGPEFLQSIIIDVIAENFRVSLALLTNCETKKNVAQESKTQDDSWTNVKYNLRWTQPKKDRKWSTSLDVWCFRLSSGTTQDTNDCMVFATVAAKMMSLYARCSMRLRLNSVITSIKQGLGREASSIRVRAAELRQLIAAVYRVLQKREVFKRLAGLEPRL